jgi:hypothetical protein
VIAEMTDEELEEHILKAMMQYIIMQFFSFSHLPLNLKVISRKFAILACEMATAPSNAETAAGLRKLLEAKDCFVRAALP